MISPRTLRFAAPLFLSIAAAAHPFTLPAFEASLDPGEARILASSPDLRQGPLPSAGGGESCALSLRLIDAETGRPIPGLVRITGPDGARVPLPGLVNRGIKLRANHPAKGWFVLYEPSVIPLPKERLRVEAFSGLETELAVRDLDLSSLSSGSLSLPLRRFHSAAKAGWRNGNTHLHLKGLTRAQSDEYLRIIPRGDGLELLFVSYLERAIDDRDYITNRYTSDDLQALSGDGLIFGNGEEHRSNFSITGNTGYGHVMFLKIRRLIQPVSIGPTLMGPGSGPDYPPLRRGIDRAHADGATVIWCHGPWGHEEVPDWLAGRLNALNIFDNGVSSSYAETFYRYLNVGLKVPFSTGTDWFIYDFSRVYVRDDRPLTVSSWLNGLEAGRTFITNGPLLELHAGSHEIGDTVSLAGSQRVDVKGRAVGRGDFQRIELIYNGIVVGSAKSRAVGGHFEAVLDLPLEVDKSGWIALRVGNGSLDTGGSLVLPPDIPFRGKRIAENEMGEALFAHTSPIYFELAHRPIFQPAAARTLIEVMEASIRSIQTKAVFANETQRAEVLDLYEDGIAMLRARLQEGSGGNRR